MLAMSAKLLFSCSAYSSPIGMRQARSSARSPAAASCSGELVVVAEQAAVVIAQRDDAGAGQRRDVDHDAPA